MRDSKLFFVFIFLIKRCLHARGYTPNSQYVGHSYHVFSKDQLSWRFFLLSYEVKFFYFLDILPIFYMVYIQHISTKDQLSWSLCFCFEVKFFYFLDILFICSMVDMNMSLPKINCPEDFVIWYYMIL
jgi:hypothetical protein